MLSLKVKQNMAFIETILNNDHRQRNLHQSTAKQFEELTPTIGVAIGLHQKEG